MDAALGPVSRCSTDLVEVLPDAVVVVDADGVVVEANRAAERLMGQERRAWVGAPGLDLVHPDDAHLAALSLVSVADKEVGTPIELRLRVVGGWRLVEVVGGPVGGGCIALVIRDLTQRRRWEVAAGDTERFRSLVQHSSALTVLVGADGMIDSTSAALTRVLGHDPERVCGRPFLDIVAPEDRVLVRGAFESAAVMPASQPRISVEALLLRAGTHEQVPFELSIVSLLDDPTVRGLVVSGHDVSRLRAAQDALAELASCDSLTGLPNRRTFDALLEHAWMESVDRGIESFVLVADLDRFKQLNDRHGHAAGDDALRRFADALRQSVRDGDIVARIGGDEFAVVLSGCGAGGVGAARDAVRRRLTERLSCLPLPLGVTFGHAALRTAPSAAAALHEADLVMLAAKRRD